jgi:hypothetical protein
MILCIVPTCATLVRILHCYIHNILIRDRILHYIVYGYYYVRKRHDK